VARKRRPGRPPRESEKSGNSEKSPNEVAA
jgi:hypothetical protein